MALESYTEILGCINIYDSSCKNLLSSCLTGVSKNFEQAELKEYCTDIEQACMNHHGLISDFCRDFFNKCYIYSGFIDEDKINLCDGDSGFIDEKISPYDLSNNLIGLLLIIMLAVKFIALENNTRILGPRNSNRQRSSSNSDIELEIFSDFDKTSDAQLRLDNINDKIDCAGEEIIDAPEDFCCPISGQIMDDPVLLSPPTNKPESFLQSLKCIDKHSYERKYIDYHFKRNGCVCPMTRMEVEPDLLTSNLSLKIDINNWLDKIDNETQRKINDKGMSGVFSKNLNKLDIDNLESSDCVVDI